MALRQQGATVLIVERGEPGHEASYAAAGMLAHCDPHMPVLLQPLATASAKAYPEFIREIEGESGEHLDYRLGGTALLLAGPTEPEILCPEAKTLTPDEVAILEPGLRCGSRQVVYLPEAALDPRQLITAVLAAVKHRGVDLRTGTSVTEVLVTGECVAGVRTEHTQYLAPIVVNCAGAWAGQLSPRRVPMRPVKGQMLAMAAPIGHHADGSPAVPCFIRHVVRAPEVYLVPRSDGRIIIGSTLEEAGFDKRVEATTIQRLHAAAIALVPQIAEARILESWAGLRPTTPDLLPILGQTMIKGYFIAAGHYRDGILLAPITAYLMAQVVRGLQPELDISAFTPSRFSVLD